MKDAQKWSTQQWVLAIALLIALAIVLLTANTPVYGNADYICTQTTQVTGECGNGSWGSWSQVSQTTNGNQTTTVERRTYTGTRLTSRTLQYLNTRSGCEGGYDAEYIGDTDQGAADYGDFSQGAVVSKYTACQIVESRTTTLSAGAATWTTSQTTSDVPGSVHTETQAAGSIGELNALGGTPVGSGGGAGESITANIVAIPALVRSGESTTVTWQGEGSVKSCTVIGTREGGGVQDRWSGASGSEKSSAIVGRTTYTLTCVSPRGSSSSESVVVNVLPVWQEN